VATLARFGGRALRSENIGELLQEATQLVSHAVEVDLVKILELLPDGQNLLVSAGVNWNPGVVGHATISAEGGSAAGHALRTDAPVISDVATERRFWDVELTEEVRHVLRIHWRERGVAINRDSLKKGRRGFGSEILERSIPEMLQGSFNRTFHPDGVECVLEFSVEE